MPHITSVDVIIVGAGAAGLMCGIEASKRGRQTIIIEHTKKIGEKIRISGGGRCNFTNLNCSPDHFLSNNPHFCKSALKQYTQYDFIALVEKHGIAYHEKTLGQLFCDQSSQQIIDMLVSECTANDVTIALETQIEGIHPHDQKYDVHTNHGIYRCDSLVIACGGLSIPKIGASKFGYQIARQFNVPVIDTFPALVPFTFQAQLLDHCKSLSGLALNAIISCNNAQFREGMLFTHRGLSGPSILQISSYWQEGDEIDINLSPDLDIAAFLKDKKSTMPKKNIDTVLALAIPQKLATAICAETGISGKIAECQDKQLERLAARIHHWRIKPAGTEGYRTAEVTRQGVDTRALSSKTLECIHQKGLYFIGEVVDVTGHLGGFNFQWAWSSGYVAGQNV